MLENELLYKKISFRIGFCLISLFLLLFGPTYLCDYFLAPILQNMDNIVLGNVLQELIDGLIYLVAFMLPVLVFYGVSKKLPTVAMPLQLSTSTDIPLYVWSGMAIILSCSLVNSLFVAVFDYSSFSSEYLWQTDVSANYQIVLLFITSALIPAVCEEFLFRGMIQSNLRMFGRSVAIIGSAVLFGLMHANAEQFLYATLAGIVLAVVREKTGSLWGSMLLHLFNNSFSVLSMSLYQRLDENFANALITCLELIVMGGGILCMIILLLKEKNKKLTVENLQEESLHASCDECTLFYIPPRKRVSLFLTPTIIVFGCYSVARAVFYIILSVLW